ncbi:MAG TPA: hypothetical protein DCZ94_09015 [Lentisphaeria bacterium]|nr:MAG: hypothetical protein A2X48_23390 [Lentisphaerae bacterium GWF2_49_21]HBC87080.1 hypothetical protein [Lentisphaeria bacterium]
MERIKKALEKVKNCPLTLDSAFRRFFEKDTFQLKDFRGSFEEMMAARLTIHLREERSCINQEIEEEEFGKLAAVIKRCPDKTTKRKGSENADTSVQRRTRRT